MSEYKATSSSFSCLLPSLPHFSYPVNSFQKFSAQKTLHQLFHNWVHIWTKSYRVQYFCNMKNKCSTTMLIAGPPPLPPLYLAIISPGNVTLTLPSDRVGPGILLMSVALPILPSRLRILSIQLCWTTFHNISTKHGDVGNSTSITFYLGPSRLTFSSPRS